MYSAITKIVFLLAGGLSLFLFGMLNLSEGLKGVASARLRVLLEKSTSSLFKGVIIGAAITCLIQSSSAMMALLIGLVNAGLIRLRQAIGVVLGANIGTTLTAWLVSLIGVMAYLSITHYVLPIIAVGLAAMYFPKGTRVQGAGRILFGLGMLLLGLSFIKDASDPLSTMGAFQHWCSNMAPLSAVLVGMVTCWIIQSSSATIALIEVFAFQGIVSLPTALGLAVGADMGTPITGEIAALTGNQAARQTARTHTLFNLFGAICMVPLIASGIWPRIIEQFYPGPLNQANTMLHIAFAHTLYNTIGVILFFPLVGFLERTSIRATAFTDRIGFQVVKRLSGGTRHWPRSEMQYPAVHLDQKVLEFPTIALDTVKQGMGNMLRLADEAVQAAMAGLFTKDPRALQRVTDIENTVDLFQKELTEFLAELIQKPLPSDIARHIPVLIHEINDIEKISDYGQDLARIATHCLDDKLDFGETADSELRSLLSESTEMIKQILAALNTDGPVSPERALRHEHQIDEYYARFRDNNIARLKQQAYPPVTAVYFLDILTKFEKIGDHLENIALGIQGTEKTDAANAE